MSIPLERLIRQLCRGHVQSIRRREKLQRGICQPSGMAESVHAHVDGLNISSLKTTLILSKAPWLYNDCRANERLRRRSSRTSRFTSIKMNQPFVAEYQPR